MHRHNSHRLVRQIAVGLPRLRHRPAGMQSFPAQPVRCGGGIQAIPVHRLLHQPGRLLQISQHPTPLGQISHALTVEKIRETAQQSQSRQSLSPQPQSQGELIEILIRVRFVHGGPDQW